MRYWCFTEDALRPALAEYLAAHPHGREIKEAVIQHFLFSDQAEAHKLRIERPAMPDDKKSLTG